MMTNRDLTIALAGFEGRIFARLDILQDRLSQSIDNLGVRVATLETQINIGSRLSALESAVGGRNTSDNGTTRNAAPSITNGHDDTARNRKRPIASASFDDPAASSQSSKKKSNNSLASSALTSTNSPPSSPANRSSTTPDNSSKKTSIPTKLNMPSKVRKILTFEEANNFCTTFLAEYSPLADDGGKNGKTAFFMACFQGKLVVVEAFIRHFRQRGYVIQDIIDHVSADGFTPLMGLLNGQRPKPGELLQKSSNPFMQVAPAERLKIANILITHGSNISHAQGDGWTPPHLAARYGWHEILSMLLSKGADFNSLLTNQMTLLHVAVEGIDIVPVVRVILQHDECTQTFLRRCDTRQLDAMAWANESENGAVFYRVIEDLGLTAFVKKSTAFKSPGTKPTSPSKSKHAKSKHVERKIAAHKSADDGEGKLRKNSPAAKNSHAAKNSPAAKNPPAAMGTIPNLSRGKRPSAPLLESSSDSDIDHASEDGDYEDVESDVPSDSDEEEEGEQQQDIVVQEQPPQSPEKSQERKYTLKLTLANELFEAFPNASSFQLQMKATQTFSRMATSVQEKIRGWMRAQTQDNSITDAQAATLLEQLKVQDYHIVVMVDGVFVAPYVLQDLLPSMDVEEAEFHFVKRDCIEIL